MVSKALNQRLSPYGRKVQQSNISNKQNYGGRRILVPPTSQTPSTYLTEDATESGWPIIDLQLSDPTDTNHLRAPPYWSFRNIPGRDR
jgi:hypothetical protein